MRKKCYQATSVRYWNDLISVRKKKNKNIWVMPKKRKTENELLQGSFVYDLVEQKEVTETLLENRYRSLTNTAISGLVDLQWTTYFVYNRSEKSISQNKELYIIFIELTKGQDTRISIMRGNEKERFIELFLQIKDYQRTF